MAEINYPFREADLLQFEATLYEPKQFIPSVRDIFSVNSNWSPGLSTYAYDYFKRTGSVSKTARAAKAKDVNFVGEILGSVTFKPLYLTTAYEYSRDERMSMATQQSFSRRPYFAIDTKRVETCARYLKEAENEVFFKGDTATNIKGLFNFTDGTHSITPTAVAQGATGATATEKKKWSNKTGQEIIADLITAKKAAINSGLYTADTLLLDPDSNMELNKPFSSQSSLPVRAWLTGEGAMFSNIHVIKECSKTFNGVDSSYDSNAGTNVFVVLENTPQVIEHCVIEDMVMLNGVYDEGENYRQIIQIKVGAPIIRYPDAIKIYRDI